MTRKDYNLIASTIKEAIKPLSISETQGAIAVTEALCRALKSTNPGFRPDTFLAAALGGCLD